MPEHPNPSRTGVIFDIQRYSIHDGAGIRTLVFMKGCPLRCLWCCNPESQSSLSELVVNSARCIRCGLCADVCPVEAIAFKPGDDTAQDRTRCQICGACVNACPTGSRALQGRVITIEDLLREVERDALFYRVSGGGVTVSGGEPLIQAPFVADFFRACRQRGIDTALETCGHAPWEDFAWVLAYTDTVLYDLKHPDADVHRHLTGIENDLILANLRRAVDSPSQIILRMPLIPGYTTDASTVRAVAHLARTLGISELHLLPYHGLGEAKYKALGRDYGVGDLTQPSAKQIEELKSIAEEDGGISVRIGG